ncbi:MAG: leucine-rich repeat domain-containing protein [Clostridia bacterium]|nr:leucine-rich repeat domain-containing protein [Clostridia bacterium]
MKRKILLTLLLVSLLICVFVIAVGAEVPEWTETKTIDGFSPKTTTDGTVTFDTTSRVMLSHTVTDPDTQEETTVYTTYPSYYILKCTDTVFSASTTEFDFSSINTATGITYTVDSVCKFEMPTGYTSMGDRVFRTGNVDCVVYVKLAQGLVSVAEFPFYQNPKIEEVYLPESLESFNTDRAFQTATALRYVNIPSCVTTIDANCFDGCSSLSTVSGLNSVTTIGERAFKNCKALKSIALPSSLETLKSYAFFGAGLESIDIPATVTTVGTGVFESNASLKFARIHGSAWGTSMFSECDALETVAFVMPESVSTNFSYGCTKFPQNAKSTGVYFFVGEDYEALITLVTAQSGNATFSDATACTYEEYLAYKEDGTVPEGKTFSGRNLLVYGCKPCDVLFDAHALSGTDTPVFTGGSFISTCNVGSICTREGCGEGVIKSTLSPLFSFAGFSKAEYTGAVMQSFAIDRSLVDEYTSLFGNISFGLIGAVEDVDPSDEVAGQFGGVLYDSESNSFKDKVASIDFSKRGYDIFELKITGLDNYANAQIYCCGYILVNGQLFYLHNGTVSNTPTTISYSSIS